VRLDVEMVVMSPKFNQTVVAYYKKFKTIFYAYKEDKIANDIFGIN